MLKRDIFIGIVIFMLFAIGLVSTLENIEREKHAKTGDDYIDSIHRIKNRIDNFLK